MQPIVIKFNVDENELIHTVTIRQYCINELSKREALKIAVRLIEEAECYNLKVYGKNIQDPNQFTYVNLRYHVSFTLLYKTKVEAKQYLLHVINILKNYNIS